MCAQFLWRGIWRQCVGRLEFYYSPVFLLVLGFGCNLGCFEISIFHRYASMLFLLSVFVVRN